MIRDETQNVLIVQLRKEASDVKACFNNFSFQALAFSSTVLAIMFGTLKNYETSVLAAIPAIVLLMIVCRIGIFKYSTANRHYGYELHLGRLYRFFEINSNKTKNDILFSKISLFSWEEALHSWRVVQTAIFRKIYKTPETDNITQ